MRNAPNRAPTIPFESARKRSLHVALTAILIAAAILLSGATAAETSLYFVATFGSSAQTILGRHLRADRGVAGYVYRTGDPYVMNDPEKDPNFYSKFDEGTDFTTACAIAVPVRIEYKLRGFLRVAFEQDPSQDVPV